MDLHVRHRVPRVMPRYDRHNEIEINYLPQGNITYLRHNEKITIPNKRFTIFWGLIPHQIIHYENSRKVIMYVPFLLSHFFVLGSFRHSL